MTEVHEIVEFGEPFDSKPLGYPVSAQHFIQIEPSFQIHRMNLERVRSIVQRMTPSTLWTFSRLNLRSVRLGF